MSKTLFSFLLRDISTIRIVCRGKINCDTPCRAVFEVPLEHMSRAFPNCCCPVCGGSFKPEGAGGCPVYAMGDLLMKIQAMQHLFDVEFAVPVEPPTPAARPVPGAAAPR